MLQHSELIDLDIDDIEIKVSQEFRKNGQVAITKIFNNKRYTNTIFRNADFSWYAVIDDGMNPYRTKDAGLVETIRYALTKY